MTHRNLRELEKFLADHGIDLNDRAFELELNSCGWRVVRERTNKQQGVELEIECLAECDEHIPRSLKIVSDHGCHDRDIALMRALERLLDFGFLRERQSTIDV